MRQKFPLDVQFDALVDKYETPAKKSFHEFYKRSEIIPTAEEIEQNNLLDVASVLLCQFVIDHQDIIRKALKGKR